MTTATTPSVHQLLLGLAGRLDDDLLAWTRELVAVGEGDQAVELATAALAAEQVALPPTLRAALVAAGHAARTDLDVDRALPPAVVQDATPHRFDATAGPGDAVVDALRALPARRLTGCTLHLTWRRTPAGAAPGPLPRAVVLVEADPDRSADVLAYLLATELERAGVAASVEVFTAGTSLPAYHAAALREAREVVRGSNATERAAPGPVGVQSDTPGVDHTEADTAVGRPAGRRRRAESPTDAVADTSATIAPVAGPADSEPLAPLPAAPPDMPPAPVPPPIAAPPMSDPLSGPLREPLLAPLLEPTVPGDESEPDEVAAVPLPTASADLGAEPAESTGPDVPDPRIVPEEWDRDWQSGEWAMPPARPAAPDEDARAAQAFDVFGTPATSSAPAFGSSTDAASDTDLGLPSRTESTGRIPRRPGPREDAAPLPLRPRQPELPPAAGQDEVSLFDSPTARVEQAKGARSTPPGGGPAGPREVPGSGPSGPRDLPAGGQPGPRDVPGEPAGGERPVPESGSGRLPSRRPGDGPPAGRRGTGGPEVPSSRNARPGTLPPSPSDRLRAVPRDEPRSGQGDADVSLFGEARPDDPGATPDDSRAGRRRRPDEEGAEGRAPAPDPEPSALLSGTERDLLAQLQAELTSRERRPRPYRRVGQNGSHAVNGHGPGHGPDGDRTPPDLAG